MYDLILPQHMLDPTLVYSDSTASTLAILTAYQMFFPFSLSCTG